MKRKRANVNHVDDLNDPPAQQPYWAHNSLYTSLIPLFPILSQFTLRINCKSFWVQGLHEVESTPTLFTKVMGTGPTSIAHVFANPQNKKNFLHLVDFGACRFWSLVISPY